jgi:hypothetical protein
VSASAPSSLSTAHSRWGEQRADRVDDDGLVRDVAVDGAVVVIVLPHAHLLPSHGPGGPPASVATAVPSSRLSLAPSATGLSMAIAERSRATAIAALPWGRVESVCVSPR